MKDKLDKLSLTPDNCVVIGSGILQAKGIRKSGDIDVVVTKEKYEELKSSGKFEIEEVKGKEILDDGLFEIGTQWTVLDKEEFDSFMDVSEIIDGVRYVTLEFLLKVKKSWIENGTVRPKDLKDIEMIEKYLRFVI